MKYYYRQKTITIPIWGGYLIFVDTNDDTALIKKHNIDLGTMPNAHSWKIWKTKDKRSTKYYVLILNTKEKYFSNGYGTLCHESAHITGFVFLDSGVKASFDNDEPFCYLQQYIFNEGAKFFFNLTNE